MDLIQETQRSLYATVGATAWMVGVLRDAPGWVGHAWRERNQVVHRLSGAYEALSERGKVIMGGAQQELEVGAQELDQAARRIPGAAEAEGAVVGAFIGEADLPIAHYDKLTADGVVHKLPGLTQFELRKVRGYETRNQARVTVIGRIDKLCEEQPWPGYDEMTLDEILPKARELPAAAQTDLVHYERRHKNRRTITDAFSHA
ncbi:hypothetical protein E1202_22935 [Saccharopolyspora karakumensis]|uniref:Uncharacterized protein n=1 Tax=Saccharopolyspora karakumensis TaxID=2530386 RepID=A0A4R5BDE8_9PSEU|nr:hypothetical protein [Saccharopolyspora karakumensis]TDD84548.1 hypothetical protein E1202_22935 [Saccharopolyspora karakumensis]